MSTEFSHEQRLAEERLWAFNAFFQLPIEYVTFVMTTTPTLRFFDVVRFMSDYNQSQEVNY